MFAAYTVPHGRRVAAVPGTRVTHRDRPASDEVCDRRRQQRWSAGSDPELPANVERGGGSSPPTCSQLFHLSNSYAAGAHSRQPKELQSGGNVGANTQHRTKQEGATARLLDAPNRNNGSDEKGNGDEPHEENSL